MKGWHEYVFSLLAKKRIRFKCDCIIPIDIEGVVVDCKIYNNEMILMVDVGGKIIQIGSNTPGLKVEEVI